jgi:hypothetical protein
MANPPPPETQNPAVTAALSDKNYSFTDFITDAVTFLFVFLFPFFGFPPISKWLEDRGWSMTWLLLVTVPIGLLIFYKRHRTKVTDEMFFVVKQAPIVVFLFLGLLVFLTCKSLVLSAGNARLQGMIYVATNGIVTYPKNETDTIASEALRQNISFIDYPEQLGAQAQSYTGQRLNTVAIFFFEQAEKAEQNSTDPNRESWRRYRPCYAQVLFRENRNDEAAKQLNEFLSDVTNALANPSSILGQNMIQGESLTPYVKGEVAGLTADAYDRTIQFKASLDKILTQNPL